MTSPLSLKNFLSVLNGICVVGLMLIALLVPPEQLRSSTWQGVIVLLGAIGVAAVLCQALRKSREDKELWNLLQGIARKVGWDSTSARATGPVVSQAIGDSDPRIYVEFADDWQGLFNQNAIVLINGGGTEALSVRVSEIRLRARTVTFDRVIPLIASGHRESIEPRVEGYGIFQRRNIARALMEEWNSFNDPNKNDLTVPVLATYEGVARGVFQTKCDLVLNPFNYIARSSGHGQARAVITVEHFELSRVGDASPYRAKRAGA
jgi:hypothetical protein